MTTSVRIIHLSHGDAPLQRFLAAGEHLFPDAEQLLFSFLSTLSQVLLTSTCLRNALVDLTRAIGWARVPGNARFNMRRTAKRDAVIGSSDRYKVYGITDKFH